MPSEDITLTAKLPEMTFSYGSVTDIDGNVLQDSQDRQPRLDG
jgi:hypothetical protein